MAANRLNRLEARARIHNQGAAEVLRAACAAVALAPERTMMRQARMVSVKAPMSHPTTARMRHVTLSGLRYVASRNPTRPSTMDKSSRPGERRIQC